MKRFFLPFINGTAPLYKAFLVVGLIGSILWYFGYLYVFWRHSDWLRDIIQTLFDAGDPRWFYYLALSDLGFTLYFLLAFICIWRCARNTSHHSLTTMARIGCIGALLALLFLLILVVTSTYAYGPPWL